MGLQPGRPNALDTKKKKKKKAQEKSLTCVTNLTKISQGHQGPSRVHTGS